MSEDKFYTRGKWRDFDRLECDLCNYDAVGVDAEEVMKEHLDNIHFPPAPPPPPSTIPRVTRFGKVIEPGAAVEILETEEDLLADGLDISGLSADDVVELVDKGELDAELVIESERSGKGRKGLLRRLGVKE